MPSQEDRDYLKSHGFRWSGKNKAWQIFNTERGLQRVNAFRRYKGEQR
jgi:Golgi nucleoside diphosphatase